MTTPNEREAFEAWVRKRHGCSIETWADSGKYQYDNTSAWWECWQAALTREQRGGDPRKAALDELARENERLGLSYADAPQQEAPGAVLASALEHIARVAMGSRTRTTRMEWIAERAKSALAGNENWRDVPRPSNYHDMLDGPPQVTPPAPVPAGNDGAVNSQLADEIADELAKLRPIDGLMRRDLHAILAIKKKLYTTPPAPVDVRVRELALEGLDYFDAVGDEGDEKYVAAIRALLDGQQAGVDDAMVERAARAYCEAATDDGFTSDDEGTTRYVKRWMTAALEAALSAKPAGEA